MNHFSLKNENIEIKIREIQFKFSLTKKEKK